MNEKQITNKYDEIQSRIDIAKMVHSNRIEVDGRVFTLITWTFGAHKSATTWQNQMNNRGWTVDQINEAIEKGEQFSAPNDVNPGNAATRYVNPTTGRYVVMDNVTNEILQLGGDGFIPK